MATTGRTSNMEETGICTSKRRNPRINNRNPSFLGTPWNRQNIRTDNMELLVARNEKRYPKIHSKLQYLSDSKTRLTGESSPSPPQWDTRWSLANNLYRHDGSITRVKRIRHHLGSSRLIHKEVVLPPYKFDDHIQRNSDLIPRQSFFRTWIAKEGH